MMLAGATWWIGTSKRRAARWVRRIVEDTRRPIEAAPLKPDPTRWSDNALTLSWLGHATVLVNFYGFRILTDPALGSRVGVSLGFGTAGPKRYVGPGLRAHELPRLDLILLSHAHMDHLDLPSLRRLNPETPVITAAATRDVLAGTRFGRIQELMWNDRSVIKSRHGDLHVQAFEVKHWGQRWPSEFPRGYNGYVLRREDKTILFGGDTALTPLFQAVRSRGPFDLAIMPIGAYRPWIWNHCTPEQALEMANRAGAHYVVPVHHQTFRLSDEPMSEPIERLEEALRQEPERLALRQVGETFVCPKT